MRNISTASLADGVWQYIELETSPDAVYSRTRSKKRAATVTSCIRQAKEYYLAARSSAIHTRPTLLYYGMVNLAKTLIALKSPNTNLNKLRHGLARGYSPKVDSLLKLRCKVDFTRPSELKGLLDLVKEDRYSHSATVNGHSVLRDASTIYTAQVATIGKMYTVRELLPLVPELFDILLMADLEIPRTVPVNYYHYYETKKTGEYHNPQLFLRHAHNDKIRSLVRGYEGKNELRDWKFKEDSLDIMKYRFQGSKSRPPVLQFRESIYGNSLHLVFPKNYRTRMAEASIHFILMFILGDVARYTPQVWTHLLGEEGRVARILEAFLEVSAVKFPLLILREMREELVRFEIG